MLQMEGKFYLEHFFMSLKRPAAGRESCKQTFFVFQKKFQKRRTEKII